LKSVANPLKITNIHSLHFRSFVRMLTKTA
jgi:hypothetical protein